MSFLTELPMAVYRDNRPADPIISPAFDFAAGVAMAWIAQLAYEPQPKIQEILNLWGLVWKQSLINPIADPLALNATRGFVAEGWGATIIAFAGTDPLSAADWLTDFETLPAADHIHTGFEDAVMSVWPALEAVLRARDAAKPLVITGHSLGGALAVVAAQRIAQTALTSPDVIYTYGQPRVGTEAFAVAYNALLGDGATPGDRASLGGRTYRFVNGDDVVATVPPSKIGFRHVGRSLRCAHGGCFNPEVTPSADFDDEPEFIESALAGVLAVGEDLLHGATMAPTQPGLLGALYAGLPPGIADHVPSRYLHAFRAGCVAAAGS